MLRIGIVGIGGIAEKAYLPFMRQLEGIDWQIFTRKTDKARQVASLFGHASYHERLEDLVKQPLDGVFIHVATAAHVEIASLFLARGIPVYMDKPISENYEEVEALYALAEQAGTFLTAGFNRRFAPRVRDLQAVPAKKQIIASKDAHNNQQDFQFELFDMFIHPLDTALFLMDQAPSHGSFIYQKAGATFVQCQVLLSNGREHAVVSMNAQSGSRRELTSVQSAEASYQLENLTDLTIFKGNSSCQKQFDSWDSTLYQRGFEGIILAFLEATQTGENPVSSQSSLLSHRICQQLNDAKETYGQLTF